MKIGIFGAAGAIGHSAVTALRGQGHQVVLVGRRTDVLEREYKHAPEAELRSADLSTAEGCKTAVLGLDAVLYTLGLPYMKKAFAAYPEMMRLVTTAAKTAGVKKFIHISNVYPYGLPRNELVDETHPREPCSVKGRFRKEQEDVVLAAHDDGGLKTLVLRLPDFYGPHAEMSLAHMIFVSAMNGKAADVLAPIDTPHEFIFVPDVGPIIAALFGRDDVWGEAYNVAGSARITVREFATKVFTAAGQKPKLRVAGPFLLRFMGLFSPVMREFVEMAYLQSTPVNLDGSKLDRTLGRMPSTSYDDGIKLTVEHLRVQAKSIA